MFSVLKLRQILVECFPVSIELFTLLKNLRRRHRCSKTRSRCLLHMTAHSRQFNNDACSKSKFCMWHDKCFAGHRHEIVHHTELSWRHWTIMSIRLSRYLDTQWQQTHFLLLRQHILTLKWWQLSELATGNMHGVASLMSKCAVQVEGNDQMSCMAKQQQRENKVARIITDKSVTAVRSTEIKVKVKFQSWQLL